MGLAEVKLQWLIDGREEEIKRLKKSMKEYQNKLLSEEQEIVDLMDEVREFKEALKTLRGIK
ncbi:MAG: hypothetical protein GY853_00530 [PVC group bacterium]|nr:hypothetical protein [PVC group bacterium]